MLVDFLLHCLFLEKSSNILSKVSHTSCTLLIEPHKECRNNLVCSTCERAGGSLFWTYQTELFQRALALSTACPDRSAQGWSFAESFSLCNTSAIWLRYIINIILLAHKTPTHQNPVSLAKEKQTTAGNFSAQQFPCLQRASKCQKVKMGIGSHPTGDGGSRPEEAAKSQRLFQDQEVT